MKTKINLSEKISKLEAEAMRSIVGGLECGITQCGSPHGSNNYIATYTSPKKLEVMNL